MTKETRYTISSKVYISAILKHERPEDATVSSSFRSDKDGAWHAFAHDFACALWKTIKGFNGNFHILNNEIGQVWVGYNGELYIDGVYHVSHDVKAANRELRLIIGKCARDRNVKINGRAEFGRIVIRRQIDLSDIYIQELPESASKVEIEWHKKQSDQAVRIIKHGLSGLEYLELDNSDTNTYVSIYKGEINIGGEFLMYDDEELDAEQEIGTLILQAIDKSGLKLAFNIRFRSVGEW